MTEKEQQKEEFGSNLIQTPPDGFGLFKCGKKYEEKLQNTKDFLSSGRYGTPYQVVGPNTPYAFSSAKAENPRRNKIFMGAEWEISVRDSSSFCKDVAKTDVCRWLDIGSGGDPIEMRTQPATVTAHKEIMDKHFFGNNLHKHLYVSGTGVGIHIHVDKSAFTPNSLRNFIVFVVNPDNREFINKVAGRPLNTGSYNKPNTVRLNFDQKTKRVVGAELKFDKDLNFEIPEEIQKAYPTQEKFMKVDLKTGQYPRTSLSNNGWDSTAAVRHGKESCVNTRTQYNTVEIRLFNTVNNAADFYRNLEFVDALCRFTRQFSSVRSLYFDKFIRWVQLHSRDYPNLLQSTAVLDHLNGNMPLKLSEKLHPNFGENAYSWMYKSPRSAPMIDPTKRISA